MDKKDVGNVAQVMLPSLAEYYAHPDERNLKKVCLEIQALCSSIYSTLYNIESKNIYYAMANNIAKF